MTPIGLGNYIIYAKGKENIFETFVVEIYAGRRKPAVASYGK